jgi:hypothetical protein
VSSLNRSAAVADSRAEQYPEVEECFGCFTLCVSGAAYVSACVVIGHVVEFPGRTNGMRVAALETAHGCT